MRVEVSIDEVIESTPTFITLNSGILVRMSLDHISVKHPGCLGYDAELLEAVNDTGAVFEIEPGVFVFNDYINIPQALAEITLTEDILMELS